MGRKINCMDVLSDVSNISEEKPWTGIRKGNLKREAESLLIAAQDKAIRTIYINTVNLGYVVI